MISRISLTGLLKSLVSGVALALMAAASHAYGLSVNAAGQPNYEFPFGVPPGINGMAPKLSLYYDPSVPRGPFGEGWALKGISVISRCPGTKPIDGLGQSVQYVPNDKLCLDGKRLIQTDANGQVINGAVISPGPANPFQQGDSLGGAREFRTEFDSHARIRSYGSASADPASGPASFKVWNKDGTVHEYKAMTVDAAGKTVAVMWVISRVADAVGNFMEFRYLERDIGWGTAVHVVSLGDVGREWNIDQILYTGNGSQQPTSRIVFEYSDRADTPGSVQARTEAYFGGAKTVVIRKLDKIHAYINWPADQAAKPATAVKVKTLNLSYRAAPLTGRILLTNFSECFGEADNKCGLAMQFTYHTGTESHASLPNLRRAFNVSSDWGGDMLSKDNKFGVLVADFNGDGRDDILRWSDNPAQNYLMLSQKDAPFIAQTSKFNILDQNLFKSDDCYRTLLIDVNADGLPDLLRYSTVYSKAGAVCGSNGVIYIYRNRGDGSFEQLPYSGPALERLESTYNYDPRRPTVRTRGANFFVIDFDRDGKTDLITSQRPQSTPGLVRPDPCLATTCTRLYRGNGDGSFSEIATNIANKPLYVRPGMFYTLGSMANIADVNGDGAPDLVGFEKGDFSYATTYISRGDGNFDAAPDWPVCTNIIDYNGDGLADCLVASSDVTKNHLMMNDGAGVLRRVTKFNLYHPGEELAGNGVGFTIVDFNKDGRDDILRWKDDLSNPPIVFLSNGDGTFNGQYLNLDSRTDRLMRSDNTALSIIGDFTGNGNIEFLRTLDQPTAAYNAGAGNQIYVWSGGGPADRLYSVGESMTATSDQFQSTYIQWSNVGATYNASAPSHLTDRGTVHAAVYPQLDVSMPRFLVTSTRDNLRGITTSYAYAGLKGDVVQQRSLGFREIRRTVTPGSGTPISYIDHFVQNATNTGTISASETRVEPEAGATARVLNRSTFIYCDMTAAATAQATATYSAPCPTSAKVRQPYLYKHKSESWDLNGMTLPTTTQTNSYNHNGDITESLVTTEGTALGMFQSFTRSTANTYHTDNIISDNWLLGKVKRTTVQSSVPNSIASIITSPGLAPNAAATSGAGAVATPPPTAPTSLPWLMPVLDLLLED